MNLVIIFILGVLVGAIFTGIVFRLFLVGTLRVDHSDPDGPFLFLELSKRVEAVVSKKYGNEGSAYISELIISRSKDEQSIYPTFKTISEKEGTS